MSDCVHTAFIDYTHFLGVNTPRSLELFHSAKRMLQDVHEFTWGGIVPCVLEYLGLYYGLRIATVQHTIWTPEFYEADAPNWRAASAVAFAEWGEHVKAITLQPAIYGLLSSNHAVFSTSIPIGEWVILAIQLERKPSLRPAELY